MPLCGAKDSDLHELVDIPRYKSTVSSDPKACSQYQTMYNVSQVGRPGMMWLRMTGFRRPLKLSRRECGT
jgi:hypothetical protein